MSGPNAKRKYSNLNSEDDVLAKASEIIKKRATASGNGGCRNYDSVRGLLQEALHCMPLEQWQCLLSSGSKLMKPQRAEKTNRSSTHPATCAHSTATARKTPHWRQQLLL